MSELDTLRAFLDDPKNAVVFEEWRKRTEQERPPIKREPLLPVRTQAFPELTLVSGAIEETSLVLDCNLRLVSRGVLLVVGEYEYVEKFNVQLAIDGRVLVVAGSADNGFNAAVFAANSLGGGCNFGNILAGQKLTFRVRNESKETLSFKALLRYDLRWVLK